MFLSTDATLETWSGVSSTRPGLLENHQPRLQYLLICHCEWCSRFNKCGMRLERYAEIGLDLGGPRSCHQLLWRYVNCHACWIQTNHTCIAYARSAWAFPRPLFGRNSGAAPGAAWHGCFIVNDLENTQTTWHWLEIGQLLTHVTNLISNYSNITDSFRKPLLNNVLTHATNLPCSLDKNPPNILFVLMQVQSTFSQHTG